MNTMIFPLPSAGPVWTGVVLPVIAGCGSAALP
jgi:hypothetical protein